MKIRRLPRDPELVVVWHLSLLKLLPFTRVSSGRVVLFLHGIEAWKRHSLWMRRLFGRVNLFLTNSDFTWKRFVSDNPEIASCPQRTVHLGIGVPVTGKLAAPESPPTALMISRLVRSEDYKGHREVLKVWKQVVSKRAEARLWIVGEGNLRPELEMLALDLGVVANVRFWGAVDEETKHRLLLKSRCLVLPSRAEGFGLVYAEAMRVGRPCLISGLDAGTEVVRPPECGLAARPSDAEELIGALERLLGSGAEWDAWSRNARERYAARFTEKHFQERLRAAIFANGA